MTTADSISPENKTYADDVICVVANGDFGGIHGQLLERLKGKK